MTTDTELCDRDALTLRSMLAERRCTALELVESCLRRIEDREPEVQAWTYLDPASARAQARALDAARDSGQAPGPLHGLPVGLKDVIDTKDMPTENGAVPDAGRVPERDAAVVRRLKQAGAIVMGKTVTTELAFMHPGKTRNPHNTAHTPGGSSSGSAAAVAAGMVPLAVGTQTGGSVIRPASFCGVTGFKPTFGLIPRSGVALQSRTLDTLGVFASDLAGAALLTEALAGPDAGDPDSYNAAPPALLERSLQPRAATPKLAFVRPPGWADADPRMCRALEGAAAALGDCVGAADLPPVFDGAAEVRARVNAVEMAHYYDRYVPDGWDGLSDVIRSFMTEGAGVSASDYIAARDYRDDLYAGLAPIFAWADAILVPAAPGPAPEGLASTGDSIFNGLWTFCGTPAVTIPAFRADDGLPMGLQLVGPRGDDGQLLQIAAWVRDRLSV